MSATTQSPATPTTDPKAPEREPSTRKRILLAEGDGFTRLVLLFRLRLAGFRVDFTSNGILAQEKLRAKRPDALLLELKLRGLSGVELIKAARSDPDFGDRPIYVYTNVDDMYRATRKEVNRLDVKVFDKRTMTREDLVRTLANALIKTDILRKRSDEKASSDSFEPEHEAAEAPVPGALKEIIAGVLSQVKALAASNDAKARTATREELVSRVHSLTSCADAAGLANLGRQSKALEDFLNQLGKEKKDRTETALATVSRAVEVLKALPSEPAGKKHEPSKFTVIIVDEAAPSNKAIKESLVQAGFSTVAFEDPTKVRDHLASNSADLVVANVLLPEAHGLAAKDIKQIPLHASTPVIFVPDSQFLEHSWEELPTSAPRVDSNPLLLKELTVKALNSVLGKNTAETAAPAPAPAPAAPKPTPPAPKVALPALGTSPVLDDGFELFKGPKRADESRSVQAPAPQTPALRPPPAPNLAELLNTPIISQAPAQPAVRPAEASNGSNGTHTILLVEDDPFVLRVYRRVLKREGFEVDVAEDGLAAVELFQRIRPNLVVLDLMLPKMHGLEVLKSIRADANLKDTPVLVLSNAYLESLEVKASQAGANKALRKTECTPTILIHNVCELLGMPARTPSDATVNEVVEAVTPEEGDFAETAIFTRQAGLRQDAPKEVVKIRQACLGFIKATDDDLRLSELTELYRRVRFLTARAGLSGLTKIAELCSALEGLLFQLVFKQIQPGTSTNQTIAQAVDCLDRLSQNRDTTFVEPRARAKVLVVDDDTVCNFTMVTTLKRAGFDAVGTQDPVESLRQMKAGSFDLVLLDVNMPVLSGFEVCEHLRRLPQYKTTPVVFVTVDAEFQNRARSVMAGGNDLMAKPLCPSELIVKVTMHLLNASAQAPATPVEPQEQSMEAWLENVLETQASQDASAQTAAAPVDSLEAVDEPAAAELSSEAGPSAEPGTTDEEFQAEALPRLQETSNDGWQTDEQPLETLQPSALQPETSEVPQMEPTTEDQMAEADTLTTAEVGSSEMVASETNEPTTQEVPPAEEFVIAGESQDGPADGTQPVLAEATQSGEPAETFEEGPEALTARISETEMELDQAKADIEQKDKDIETLRSQLQELASGTQEPEPLAGNGHQATSHVSPAEAEMLAQSTAALAEAQAHRARLEQELAELRQTGEELKAKLAREQREATDTSMLAHELEQRVTQSKAELEKAQAEATKHKQDKELAESEFRRQLNAAMETGKQTEAAHKGLQERCSQLERELSDLRATREQLDGKFTKEQEATAQSRSRIQELESRLDSKASELEKARAELETRAKERANTELDLRRQLELASAAGKQSESSRQQAQTRCGELEQELAALRQAREQLTGEFAKEHQTVTETGSRLKQLEGDLESKAAEFARAKTELEKAIKERQVAESELRSQLEAASSAGKQSETARQEAQVRCRDLEQQLADARRARQEVAAEADQRVKELANHLDNRSVELQRTKGDFEKQQQEHARAASDLRSQLEAATVATGRTDAAHKEAQARCTQLEKELAELRQTREQLTGKFAQEQETTQKSTRRIEELEKQLEKRALDLKQAGSDLEAQAKERERLEADLRRQLEQATAASQQNETAHKQAQTRSTQLERELADLHAAHERLDAKSTREHEIAEKSARRVEELEKYLDKSAAEVKRANAEFEDQAKKRARVEAELQRQVELATATSNQNETAHKQAQARCRQLEQELAGLRQAREELNGKFTKEQQVTTESRSRVKELENQLGSKGAELERSKSELENAVKERARVEAELRQQLESANAASKQNETGHKQAQARLEEELANLRQSREDLTGKFAKEQQVTTESRSRIKELENQLGSRGAELERAKAKLENATKERARVEADLQRQLESANAASTQKETTLKAAQGQLEKELAGLRQSREDLSGKFAQEQQVTNESRSRIKELENQLGSRGAELERAKSQLENAAKEHARVEAELRQQLESANAASKQNETTLKAAQTRLEDELAGLRQAREDLSGKFANEQQVTTESRSRIKDLENQLGSRGAELERAKAELENVTKERARVETDLRRQLESANAANTKNESASRASQMRLEQELAALRHAREDLTDKFAKEQQVSTESRSRLKELENQLGSKGAELERAKSEMENAAKERARVEADLRQQLQSANATSSKNESALKATQGQLEQELAAIRQAREELNGKFAKEQQLTTESRSRIKDLESQLASKASALENAVKERAAVEADLRKQLELTTAAGKQTETTLKATQSQLEQELAALRQAGEELNGRFTREQQVTTESRSRIKDLETHLDSKTAELERSRIDWENQTNERARVEADLRRQLEQTVASGKQNEAELKSAQGQLEQELAGLRQVREELNGKFAKEQQTALEARAQIKELERQLQTTEAQRAAQVSELDLRVGHGVAALARVTAELSKEQGERQRSEQRAATLNTELQQLHVKFSNLLQTQQTNLERIAALEEKLLQSGHELARRSADVEQHQAESRLAKEQLHSAKSLNANLRKHLTFFEAAHNNFERAQQELQSKLDSSLSSMQATEAKLQSESAERQRLAETLVAAQRELETQSNGRQTLEAELQATLNAKQHSDARLRKEATERQTLSEAHSALQRELQGQSQKRHLLEKEVETARNVMREIESRLQTETQERQRLAAILDSVQRQLQDQTRRRETLENEVKTSAESLRGGEARLQKEAAERQSLAESLDKVQRELQSQSRKRESLETELRTALDRLQEREAGLEKETAERRRLSQALEATRLNLQDHSQRSELEFSKLQSALQFEQAERKRQEIQLARMRHFSLDAARGARSLRNILRRQIREPLDNLCLSTRRLLALDLDEQHKKLAEAVLHDAMAVQARLREPELPRGTATQTAPEAQAAGNGSDH